MPQNKVNKGGLILVAINIESIKHPNMSHRITAIISGLILKTCGPLWFFIHPELRLDLIKQSLQTFAADFLLVSSSVWTQSLQEGAPGNVQTV